MPKKIVVVTKLRPQSKRGGWRELWGMQNGYLAGIFSKDGVVEIESIDDDRLEDPEIEFDLILVRGNALNDTWRMVDEVLEKFSVDFVLIHQTEEQTNSVREAKANIEKQYPGTKVRLFTHTDGVEKANSIKSFSEDCRRRFGNYLERLNAVMWLLDESFELESEDQNEQV